MLSFFSKSLTSEEKYSPGRDTMLKNLESMPTDFGNKNNDLRLEFRNMHLALYTKNFATARSVMPCFYSSTVLTQLRSLSYQQAFDIAIVNIASLFDYGTQSPFRYMFELANHFSNESDLMLEEEMNIPRHLKEPQLAGISDVSNQAVSCTFVCNTFTIFLQREDYSHALGHILALLTFLCSLDKASKSTSLLLNSSMFMVQQIFDQVPWKPLCSFLNQEAFELFRRDHALSFPGFCSYEEQPLPEDWSIRGLIWTAGHFPSTWFDDKREPEIEDLKHGDLRRDRIQRIVYLTRALCSVSIPIPNFITSLTWSQSGYMSFEDGLFWEEPDSKTNRISLSTCKYDKHART